MKKLFISFMGLLLVTTIIYGQETSSTRAPENYQPIASEPFVSPNRSGTCEFLVFRDNLPWNSTAVTDILTANAESFTVATSAQMVTIDFSLYDVIIIESDQNSSFHANFVANFAKFVTFVTNGGRLEVHAATCGWNSPGCESVQLPGGVSTVSNYLENYNNVVDIAHPIVAGVTNPFYGSYASHGYFVNLVTGTDIITETQNGNYPTTIQYNYGTGTVTATACTYEYGYAAGQEAGEMLVNNLNYSCEFVPVPLSNWALGIGIFLIVIIALLRFRKVI